MPVHFGWLTISFWPGLAHFGPAWFASCESLGALRFGPIPGNLQEPGQGTNLGRPRQGMDVDESSTVSFQEMCQQIKKMVSAESSRDKDDPMHRMHHAFNCVNFAAVVMQPAWTT